MGMLITFICGLVTGGIIGFIAGMLGLMECIKEGKVHNVKYTEEK